MDWRKGCLLNNLINLINVNKYFKLKEQKLHVLKNINLTINEGDFLIIMGKSGSGKTTLLNLLGLLDKFDNGNYNFNKSDISWVTEDKKSELRNRYFGFIFQQFYLIESLTIGQNIELPLFYREKDKMSKIDRRALIQKYLDKVGLLNKENQSPLQLSGGQQQCVAIGRALINEPSIIFADEPTGSLDSESSKNIMNMLKELNEKKKTIVMVTHDKELIRYASKVIHLKDGLIVDLNI